MHHRFSRCLTCFIVKFVNSEPRNPQPGEHGPVAQPLPCVDVGRVQQSLRLAERKPVADAHSSRPDALDPGDSSSKFRRQRRVIGEETLSTTSAFNLRHSETLSATAKAFIVKSFC
jgi:hypothetical protein